MQGATRARGRPARIFSPKRASRPRSLLTHILILAPPKVLGSPAPAKPSQAMAAAGLKELPHALSIADSKAADSEEARRPLAASPVAAARPRATPPFRAGPAGMAAR